MFIPLPIDTFLDDIELATTATILHNHFILILNYFPTNIIGMSLADTSLILKLIHGG